VPRLDDRPHRCRRRRRHRVERLREACHAIARMVDLREVVEPRGLLRRVRAVQAGDPALIRRRPRRSVIYGLRWSRSLHCD